METRRILHLLNKECRIENEDNRSSPLSKKRMETGEMYRRAGVICGGL